MITSATLLIGPAQQAGIELPESPLEKYDPLLFPHWCLYTSLQLGARLPTEQCHWSNAKVIAALTHNEACSISLQELMKRGFQL